VQSDVVIREVGTGVVGPGVGPGVGTLPKGSVVKFSSNALGAELGAEDGAKLGAELGAVLGADDGANEGDELGASVCDFTSEGAATNRHANKTSRTDSTEDIIIVKDLLCSQQIVQDRWRGAASKNGRSRVG